MKCLLLTLVFAWSSCVVAQIYEEPPGYRPYRLLLMSIAVKSKGQRTGYVIPDITGL